MQSLALSKFTLLCNHHHLPSPEHFYLPKLKCCPIKHQLCILPTPQLLAIPTLFSVSMNLTALNTSYQWNHPVFVLLGQNFLPFQAEWYSIVCIHHSLFIHSAVDRQLGYFHLRAVVNNPVTAVQIQSMIKLLLSQAILELNRVCPWTFFLYPRDLHLC